VRCTIVVVAILMSAIDGLLCGVGGRERDVGLFMVERVAVAKFLGDNNLTSSRKEGQRVKEIEVAVK
jgi:hypothetical protein